MKSKQRLASPMMRSMCGKTALRSRGAEQSVRWCGRVDSTQHGVCSEDCCFGTAAMSTVFSPSVYAVLREAGARRRGAFGPGASAGNQNKQGSSHSVARHVPSSRLPGSKRPARSAHNSRSPKSLPYKLSYNKSTPDSQVVSPRLHVPSRITAQT